MTTTLSPRAERHPYLLLDIRCQAEDVEHVQPQAGRLPFQVPSKGAGYLPVATLDFSTRGKLIEAQRQ